MTYRRLRALQGFFRFGRGPARAWRGAAARVIAVALLCAPAAARADGGATAFDGIWVLDATVEGGLCPKRSKQLFFALQNAEVVKLLGLPSPTVSGRVEPDGRTLFTLQTLGATAHINGKMAATEGAGSWASDSFLCPNGAWRARKAQ
jgi:hypothetical protein